MSKFKEKLDNIFTALYGTDIDEYGERYKEVYRHEVKGMEYDFYEYIQLMNGMPFDISVDDLAKFLVWTEFNCIGNTRYEKNVDYEKLKEIVADLISE